MSKDNGEKGKRQDIVPLVISAEEFLETEFPEPQWIVEGVVPEGSLCLLSARPKAGKTSLSIQMTVAVASGRLFLMKKTKKVPVLFLSYELNQRQFKKRLLGALEYLGVSPNEIKGNVFLSFAGRRGVDSLREGVSEIKDRYAVDVKLVFIDTYVLFRDISENARKSKKTIYEIESEYLAGLRDYCEDSGVSVVLIYHNRKKQVIGGDITEEVMGSTGITGGVNNLLVLDRKTGSKEARLTITGHDVWEQEIELTFENGFFRLRSMTDREQEIVELIVNYLRKMGQANQSSIIDYLKRRGYKSVGEIKDILDKYSQENETTETYWYFFKKKREGGGTAMKIYFLNPPPEIQQEIFFEEQEDNEGFDFGIDF